MQSLKAIYITNLNNISSRIPYMRWSNAFMLYAMIFLLRNNLGK